MDSSVLIWLLKGLWASWSLKENFPWVSLKQGIVKLGNLITLMNISFAFSFRFFPRKKFGIQWVQRFEFCSGCVDLKRALANEVMSGWERHCTWTQTVPAQTLSFQDTAIEQAKTQFDFQIQSQDSNKWILVFCGFFFFLIFYSKAERFFSWKHIFGLYLTLQNNISAQE